MNVYCSAWKHHHHHHCNQPRQKQQFHKNQQLCTHSCSAKAIARRMKSSSRDKVASSGCNSGGTLEASSAWIGCCAISFTAAALAALAAVSSFTCTSAFISVLTSVVLVVVVVPPLPLGWVHRRVEGEHRPTPL